MFMSRVTTEAGCACRVGFVRVKNDNIVVFPSNLGLINDSVRLVDKVSLPVVIPNWIMM